MKFLAVSNITSITEEQLQALADTRLSYCIFLGDVAEECMEDISHVVGCDSYALLGDQDNELKMPKNIINLHNQCFIINDKKVGGFQYSNYFTDKNSWNDQYVDDCLINADVLFTHHSPIVRVDKYGYVIMPDYVTHLIQKVDPWVSVCGHESQNYIGSIQRYKHNTVKTININGIALIQLNDDLQIKKLIIY